MSGTSNTATDSGDLANVQSEPPLPGNQAGPIRGAGFFLPEIPT